jgi:AraC-like DNA-binding protein
MNEYSVYNAVLLFIRNSPSEEIGNLTVTGIARKFKINRTFLARSFHKYDILSPKRYLDIYTLIEFNRVAYSLKNPTVKEALERMNIKNTSQFIKRYKRESKITPGQYCKESRKKKREWQKEWKRRWQKKRK